MYIDSQGFKNNFEENDEKETQVCENCNDKAFQYYYCEFCKSNYCVKCTIDKTHNAYYNSETNIVRCEQIHKFPLNDNLAASNTDIET